MPRTTKATWRRELKSFIIMAVVLFGARSSLADWYQVPTGSMKPTIVEGDRVFVNKLAYDLKVPFTTVRIHQWSEPQPGEIIVFKSPRDGKRLIKRVVAGPGDTVSMLNDVLIVNGKPAAYTAIEADTVTQLSEGDAKSCDVYREDWGGDQRLTMLDPRRAAVNTFAPVTVPPDTWFFLGDNRNNSLDSRFIGCVPRQAILGRAQRVIISFDPANHLPRKKRLFEEL